MLAFKKTLIFVEFKSIHLLICDIRPQGGQMTGKAAG